jgi:Glycosyltransferase family 87
MSVKQKKNFKFVIFYACVLILIVGCTIRLYDSFVKNDQVDFTRFVDCAETALRGDNFYDISKLKYAHNTEPVLVFPGMLLFYIPFAVIDINVGRGIYYIFNIIATLFVFVWGFHLTGGLKKVKLKSPDINAALFFAGIFVFLNSAPVLMNLRHGQQTIFISCGILLLLSLKSRYVGTVMFSLATLMKYSMMSLFAPLLFLKKRYFICIVAFFLFLLLCLYPVLLGYNVLELYQRYVEAMINVFNGGCCSFKVSGYNMLQIEFFQACYLNLIGKFVAAAIALAIIWRERKKPGISLNLILVIFCFTMLISYHRLYDLSIVMLLLLLKTRYLIVARDWKNSLICVAFLFCYTIPFSWVLELSDIVGRIFPLKGFVQLCNYRQFSHLLPVSAWMMLALSVYVLYLYMRTGEEFVFQLEPAGSKDNSEEKK